MERNYKVITLCGSARFKDLFAKIAMELTLEGHLVFSLSDFFNEGSFREDYKLSEIVEILGKMHLRKIDLSDEIFVINKDRYIGVSTQREIAYAISHGKVVRYLES